MQQNPNTKIVGNFYSVNRPSIICQNDAEKMSEKMQKKENSFCSENEKAPSSIDILT